MIDKTHPKETKQPTTDAQSSPKPQAAGAQTSAVDAADIKAAEVKKPQSTYEKMRKNAGGGQAKTDGLEAQQQKIAELEKALEAAQAAEKNEKLKALAEIQNMQARYQREKETVRDYAVSEFAKHMMDVADAVEQGLVASQDPAQKEGLEMIWKAIQSSFQKNHMVAINPLHEPYDAHHHEAMAMQPSQEVPDRHVIQVIQQGYKLKDRLLRPARVIVCKNEG